MNKKMYRFDDEWFENEEDVLEFIEDSDLDSEDVKDSGGIGVYVLQETIQYERVSKLVKPVKPENKPKTKK